ncbi:hypothetical protein A0H81_09550 [Grifola frondosa]|uniref:Uncharacterized protein n=1 Tax=Grifola frondosa TaxID=5627 RepID=A0A1C7M047_GRIFR|nr:hypothetical protein A0H81_09550 [Grifola frondosa]
MSTPENEDIDLLAQYGLHNAGEGVDPYVVTGTEHLSSDMQRMGVDNHIDVLCIDNNPVSICVVGRVVPPTDAVDNAGTQPFISLQPLRHRDLVAARVLQGQRSNPEVVSASTSVGSPQVARRRRRWPDH